MRGVDLFPVLDHCPVVFGALRGILVLLVMLLDERPSAVELTIYGLDGNVRAVFLKNG